MLNRKPHKEKAVLRGKTPFSRTGGFSIAEVLVTTVILSLFMAVATTSLVTMLKVNARARSYSLALDNVNIILESLTRNVREGSNYHCGGTDVTPYDVPQDCPNGDDVLAFERPDGDLSFPDDQVVYMLGYDSALKPVVQVSSNAGNSVDPISLQDVSIDRLKFYVTGTTDPDQVPMVRIEMGGYAGEGIKDRVRFDVQTTVSSRLSPTINQSATGFLETPPDAVVDTAAPSIDITNPAANSSVYGGSSVVISATASDNTGGVGVAAVSFFVVDTDTGEQIPIGTDYSEPYTASWNTLLLEDQHWYVLVAKARDFNGNEDEDQISVFVDNPDDRILPTIDITAPSGGTVIADTEAIHIVISASDNNAVSRVQVFFDGVYAGDAAWSYGTTYTFDRNARNIQSVGCDAGTRLCPHIIQATASDVAGNMKTDSVPISIKDTQGPVLGSLMVSPGLSFPSGTHASVSIHAVDYENNTGSGVQYVQFYVKRQGCGPLMGWLCNTQNLGDPQVLGPDYTVSWSPDIFFLSEVKYKVWAEAYDNVSNKTKSDELTVTVTKN